MSKLDKRDRTIEEKLKPLGLLIRRTGAAKFFHNGDGTGFLWRWWHPLAWVMVPLLIVLQVLIEGIPEMWRSRSDLGLRLPRKFDQETGRFSTEPMDVDFV